MISVGLAETPLVAEKRVQKAHGSVCLVTSGPYRRVRNPMYTSIYIILISFFLASANWLIGLAWLTGYTVLMISRVPNEEALMEQKFGDKYNAWAEHTGRFLPRFSNSDS